LSLNNDETRRAREEANARIHDVVTPFEPGDLLARAGNRWRPRAWSCWNGSTRRSPRAWECCSGFDYSLATLGMFVALLTLCGVYVLAYERN
jgi:hypothetical protein